MYIMDIENKLELIVENIIKNEGIDITQYEYIYFKFSSKIIHQWFYELKFGMTQKILMISLYIVLLNTIVLEFSVLIVVDSITIMMVESL